MSGAPHLLIVTGGTAGDMYPFLHLARTLLARGHRVTVVGPQAHARMGPAAGVPFVGVGTEDEYRALLEHPDVWHPRRGLRVLLGTLADRVELLADVVDTLAPDEACAMLAHPLALPAAELVRARRPGLRVVAAWLAPANLRTLHDPLTVGPLRIPSWVPPGWRRRLWERVDTRIVDPAVLPTLNAVRARHGLAPAAHYIGLLQAIPDAHLTLFPPWFGPTQPDWPRPLAEGRFALYDPFLETTLAPEVAHFLAAGDPPIVVTPGSGNRQAAAWLAQAVRAASRLGRRAILLTPHRAQAPATLPGSVLWRPYVPLRALLPRAAALVHHGGIGTTAEALRAGVPQLVVPLAYDQFDNAARLEALQAGRGARLQRLAPALASLLASDTVRAGCARAARLAEQDQAADVAGATARTLEDLLLRQ